MNILKCIIILLVIHLGFESFSQTTSEVLASYRKSPTLQYYEDFSKSIDALKFKIPFVEEVNFRTETDQFDFGRQEFALRTMFNSPKESKIYKTEKENLIALKFIEKKEKEAKLIYELYKDIIDLKYKASSLPLYDSLENIYNQKLNLLIITLGTGEFVQPRDIIKIEEAIFEIKQKRKINTNEVKTLHQKLGVSTLSFDDWVDVKLIKEQIEKLSYRPSQLEAEKYDFINLRNKTKYQLDKANDNRILDYAQLRYSRRDNLLFADEFSIGVGVRFPYSGSNIKSKNDFLVKESEILFERQLENEEALEDFNKDKQALLSLIEELDFYNITNAKIFKTLNENHQLTVSELANTKALLYISNKEKEIELMEKITELYINILNDSTLLSSEPYKNYLTNSFKSF